MNPMTGRRSRELLRHKRILIAVRLVFFVLISSLALPDFLKGSVSPVLPIVLAAYFFTHLGMAFEKSQTFLQQRVQACLLIFDIAVLVVATAFLDAYRQDLFLAMFLVVLLASASQRLSVSIGGFLAVAAYYVWSLLQSPEGLGGRSLASLASGLPVLLVVAIYVGYVSENVARERRRREQTEEHLTREVQGMNRLQALAMGNVAEQDPGSILGSVAETARGFLGAPRAAVFCRPRAESAWRLASCSGLPDSVARSWAAEPGSPLHKAAESPDVLRLHAEGSAAPHPWIAASGTEAAELLLAPLADRVDGSQAVLAVGMDRPHDHLPAEEDALKGLAQQAGLVLENASLYRLLSQTRDLWQAAFQSIPTPVVIVDAASRILQANPAFLNLGSFDLSTIVGSPFAEVLEGASKPDGGALKDEAASLGTVRLVIPKLRGEFDVNRGPYLGTTPVGGGIVWVLRKLPAGVGAG